MLFDQFVRWWLPCCGLPAQWAALDFPAKIVRTPRRHHCMHVPALVGHCCFIGIAEGEKSGLPVARGINITAAIEDAGLIAHDCIVGVFIGSRVIQRLVQWSLRT